MDRNPDEFKKNKSYLEHERWGIDDAIQSIREIDKAIEKLVSEKDTSISS